MTKYFGTDGVRGIVNKTLKPELAFKLGRVGGYVLTKNSRINHKQPRILVAHDTRISGAMLEDSLISGLLSVGVDVLTLGIIPTPALSYLVNVQDADAGIMISASHNPVEYNGIKFFGADGYKLSDKQEREIEGFLDVPYDTFPLYSAKGLGKIIDYPEGSLKYSQFLEQSVDDDLSGISMIIDGANGATSSLISRVFADLECDFETIATSPDGLNINENVGSTHPKKLSKAVIEKNAQIGLAFDGDGDRCIAIDENGELVDGDKILFILGKYFNEHGRLKKSTVVTTIMSNVGLYKALENNGINYVQTDVGDHNVLREIENNGYNLGGEKSGHIIIYDLHNTGDGMLTAIQLLNIMKKTGKKLSELAKDVKFYPQTLINVKVSDKEHWKDHSSILEIIDDIRQRMNDDGRVIVRSSGTENVIRVMVEAPYKDDANQYAHEIAKVIDKEMGIHH